MDISFELMRSGRSRPAERLTAQDITSPVPNAGERVQPRYPPTWGSASGLSLLLHRTQEQVTIDQGDVVTLSRSSTNSIFGSVRAHGNPKDSKWASLGRTACQRFLLSTGTQAHADLVTPPFLRCAHTISVAGQLVLVRYSPKSKLTPATSLNQSSVT